MISLQDLWKQQQGELTAQLRCAIACLEAKKEDPDYIKAAIKELQHLNSQEVRIKHALSLIWHNGLTTDLIILIFLLSLVIKIIMKNV